MGSLSLPGATPKSSEESHTISLLEQCEAQIATLKDKYEEQCSLKKTLRQNLLVIRSWTAPVGRVPNEILENIFSNVVKIDPFTFGACLLVCRQWAIVATHTPTLWSTISLEIPPNSTIIYRLTKYVHSAIRHSKNRLLDVSLTMPQHRPFLKELAQGLTGTSEDDSTLDILYGNEEWLSRSHDIVTLPIYQKIDESLCDLMLAIKGSSGTNLHRVRSLYLLIHTRVFFGWIEGGGFHHHPTPLLKNLEILAEKGHDDELLCNLFDKPIPSLRCLSSNRVGGLKAILDCTGRLEDLQLSFNQMNLSFFPDSVYLKYLTRLCLGFPANTMRTTATITLPLLEELILTNNDPLHLFDSPKLLILRLLRQVHAEGFENAPNFPLLQKFHVGPGFGDIEPIIAYFQKLTSLIEIGIMGSSMLILRRCMPRLKNDPAFNTIIIRGFLFLGLFRFSFQEIMEYEKHEVVL
jgi:hypothetical protein